MIDKVYVSHSEDDENMAWELANVLWAVNLESFSCLYRKAQALSQAERIRFGIHHSDCVIPILSRKGIASPRVNQEIGLAIAFDSLIIPLAEDGMELPVLIRHLHPIIFSGDAYEDALGRLIETLRQLTRLEWLKIKCPYCGEEMTQYITSQEDVDRALVSGKALETMCSYCESALSLDPRTFQPIT
jgi:ribosomal protein S27E